MNVLWFNTVIYFVLAALAFIAWCFGYEAGVQPLPEQLEDAVSFLIIGGLCGRLASEMRS